VRSLRVEAPAKINLTLTIVGRRPDGYHLLESTLVLLALADRLTLRRAGGGLRMTGDMAADVPDDATNLAWRGLTAVVEDLGSIGLALEKHIPSAAGLGGGSSDAAAAWHLGRAALGVDAAATDAELVALGRIGADVPFFAAGLACARVSGIGERVVAAEPLDRRVVLVQPSFRLPTAAVFAELRPSDWGSGGNDLLAPAIRLRAELEDVRRAMLHAGADPQLSGSGPTMFSLFEDADAAAAAVARLRQRGLHATMTRTRTAAAEVERLALEEDQ
jgi:4-diphosphocytidyl-2-C-methyl-D-erythritol kinase